MTALHDELHDEPHHEPHDEAPAPGAPDEAPVCSARGCRADAVWAVRWNNPRLHTPERRKVWLACDAHRTGLEEFLALRGFHRDTVPLAELPADGR